MLGLTERPRTGADERILPLERFGIEGRSRSACSSRTGTPVIWRGPMITKLLTQFLREVDWGELDVLVLDLPPGTGDAQLTIAQQAPLTGGVIVTTPQDVALLDVQRGIDHVQPGQRAGARRGREHELPRLQRLRAPGRDLRPRRRRAAWPPKLGFPFLGEIPLVRAIRESRDGGEPIVVAAPESPQSEAFRDIARRSCARSNASRKRSCRRFTDRNSPGLCPGS